jgi:hypothetical protein
LREIALTATSNKELATPRQLNPPREHHFDEAQSVFVGLTEFVHCIENKNNWTARVTALSEGTVDELFK